MEKTMNLMNITITTWLILTEFCHGILSRITSLFTYWQCIPPLFSFILSLLKKAVLKAVDAPTLKNSDRANLACIGTKNHYFLAIGWRYCTFDLIL